MSAPAPASTLTVAQLSAADLRARLRGPGLRLRTGPFVLALRSTIAEVADGVTLMYADYPVLGPEHFADFHINMAEATGWHRWVRPQVHFLPDGEAPFQPLPRHHAFPLFEWSFNWCISGRAHDWLILHAAVVEKDGCAAILPAPPGSGKSTLCAGLAHRGWRLLSDELTMISLTDGLITPVPRPISLKNASLDVMRAYVPGAVFSKSVNDTSKGVVTLMKPPAASVARAHELARPAWVVFPQYVAGAAASLSPVAPARAFMQLAENSFNYNVLGAAGFDAMTGLVERSSSYQFTYSVLDEAIAVFDALPRPAR